MKKLRIGFGAGSRRIMKGSRGLGMPKDCESKSP